MPFPPEHWRRTNPGLYHGIRNAEAMDAELRRQGYSQGGSSAHSYDQYQLPRTPSLKETIYDEDKFRDAWVTDLEEKHIVQVCDLTSGFSLSDHASKYDYRYAFFVQRADLDPSFEYLNVLGFVTNTGLIFSRSGEDFLGQISSSGDVFDVESREFEELEYSGFLSHEPLVDPSRPIVKPERRIGEIFESTTGFRKTIYREGLVGKVFEDGRLVKASSMKEVGRWYSGNAHWGSKKYREISTMNIYAAGASFLIGFLHPPNNRAKYTSHFPER